MKSYEANTELIEILKSNGFIETTSEISIKKKKKNFKLSKQSKKAISFDHINIYVIYSRTVCESRIRLSETDLKCLLLYFKLKASDLKEISESSLFNFVKMENKISAIRKELKSLKDLNIKNTRQDRLAAIIEIFDKIELN